MKRKIISLLIVFSLCATCLNVNIADVYASISNSTYTATIGSQTIPFADYPVGSYFTDNGSACNDHSSCRAGASLYNESACNCKCTYNGVALNSTSCYGFANMVFYRLFGHTTYSQTTKVVTNISASSINSTYLYNLFTNGTVKAGAHIRNSTHSMIFMGCDSSYIYTYEGNYDSHCKVGVIRRTWSEMVTYLQSKNGIAFIQMPNSYPNAYTEAPNNPNNLWSDKTVYNSSESITLSWDAALGATHYWVYMWKDGVQLYGTDMGNATSFTSAPTSPGNYTFIVRAGNNIGYSGGISCNFTVTNDIPDKVTNIWTNKSEYEPNDDITFYWDKAYGAQEYWVYLWKDGTQISMNCVGNNTYYNTSLVGSGEYTLVIRPGNVNGFNDGSTWYSFEVKKPLFEISSNRTVYKSSESIGFTWNLVDGATDYWVYMWKDGVELYSVNMGNNTGFTSAPTSPGKYIIIVRAIANNSSYADDSFDFTVTDDIPSSVTNIRSDKTSYIPYENIKFEWDNAYGTQEYWAYLWKDGVQLSMQCVYGNTKYETTLLDSGKYTLIVRPGNVNGFNDSSQSYTFNVGLYSVEYYTDSTSEIFNSQTKKYESHLAISDKIPEKEGYIFMNWNTEEDGTGDYYGIESIYTANKSIKLYAQWEKAIPYTESNVTKSGANLIIDTKVHNITEPYDILIVGYKENRFVTMKRVPHDEQNSPYTLEGDIDEIKVMVWNGLSNLKPLCEVEEIPSSKWITE